MATGELTKLAFEYADALSSHDVGRLLPLLNADYVNHNPYVKQVVGPESAMSFFADWLAAFPDAEVVCEDTLAVGTSGAGKLCGRFTYVGTFTNPTFGLPPTHKRVVMRSIDIWRVNDGQFAEHWDELNTADWFAQLGGADPQPRTGAAA
jgi:steroid delta-isomerase-like uncharacterized protein